MWRGIQIFIGCLNIAVIIMAAYFLWHGGVASIQNHQVIEYKDFVSILLTAIAVMIAVVTIFVAAAAFWGFGAIRDAAREEADQRATQSVAEQMRNQMGQPSPDRDIGAAAGRDKT